MSIKKTMPTEAEIAKLSPKHAAALLNFEDGMSYEAIAAAMGIAEGTVKSGINRARAKLAKLRKAGEPVAVDPVLAQEAVLQSAGVAT